MYKKLQNQIASLNNKITSLNDKNTSLNNEITSLNDKNTSLNNEITSLNNQNTSLNDKITSINNQNTSLNDKITSLNDKITCHEKILLEYDQKFDKNEEKNKFKSDYSLLLFSSKIKNYIAFFRIVAFRKIVNILLIKIIEKNKKYLRRTSTKFFDELKPKNNQKFFYIIYCCENKVKGVEKNDINIIIDFLMFIHDYSSMKIHLNNIEEKDIIKDIKKNDEDNSSDEAKSSNKTDSSSINTGELVDYVFNPYIIKDETKKLIKEIENEEAKIVKKNGNDEEKKENNERTNELTNLLEKIINDKKKIENEAMLYEKKVNNYKSEISKEFCIEEILRNYISQFDMKSTVYQGKEIDLKKHYRFNSCYQKIIDAKKVRNIELTSLNEKIKKLTEDDTVDILFEDQGKFGSELDVADP
jgi:FtsZ-binding cell division protein ZapB